MREFVHQFAETQLRPLAREADEKGELPKETIKQLAQFVGNRATVSPDESPGGVEGGPRKHDRGRWLGRACMGRSRGSVEHPRPRPCGAFDRWHRGPPNRRSDSSTTSSTATSDEPRFGALAVTEPQAGSDVSNVQTTAVRDGDEWVLNGSKIYCTNGARAEIVVVNATVDKSLGRQGQKFFVIEKGTPGFKIGKIEKKMGLTASETAEFTLEDCRVSMDHLLGGEAALEPKGSGFKGTMKAFDSSRPSVAAMALGIGRAAFEYVRDWVAAELPTNGNLGRRAAIDQKLGQMKRELGAARGLVWQAAWMADNKIPNSKEASMSKAYAPQAALRACIGAIQIMGPEGYSKEHLVEKWFRDIKVYDIFEGTGQIQRVVISRNILGRLD